MDTLWTPPSALRWLLRWTALTTIVFWLGAVRGAFDGISYQWGLVGFRGHGTQGDYWFPVVGSVVSLVVLAFAWRGGKWPISLVVAAWHLFLLGAAIWLAVSFPDLFRFRGDTAGIDISLTQVGPVVVGLGAALGVAWVLRSFRQGEVQVAPWNARNRRWLVALTACLPLQLVLLRAGAPHGVSDQLGVFLTIVQWLLMGAVFRPYPVRDVPPDPR